MKWITSQIIDECVKAEKDWLQRLPKIIERSKATREQWLEEEEHKRRWKELIV